MYSRTICFLVVAEQEDRNGDALDGDDVFSPLGWLAGLVTRLNRHGYFISRPLKRADPTHDPRKPRNGGPRVGRRPSPPPRVDLGRRRFCRFAVRTQ